MKRCWDFAFRCFFYYCYSVAKLLLLLSLMAVRGEKIWPAPTFSELILPHSCNPLSLEYCFYSFSLIFLFCLALKWSLLERILVLASGWQVWVRMPLIYSALWLSSESGTCSCIRVSRIWFIRAVRRARFSICLPNMAFLFFQRLGTICGVPAAAALLPVLFYL